MTAPEVEPIVPIQRSCTYAPAAVPEVARRTFLKLLGLAALPIVTGIPLFKLAAWPDQDHTAATPLHLADYTQALLLPAIVELQQEGFPFDIEQSVLVQLPQQPQLLGLLLHDTRLPPRHDGADIALTVDLHAPQRSSLSYVVGRSTDDGLEIRHVVLATDRQRQQRLLRRSRDAGVVQQRLPIYTTRRMLYHTAHPAPAAGAAAEAPFWHEQTHWYYNHCGGALWLDIANGDETTAAQLRFTTCEEYRNHRLGSIGHARRSHSGYGETHTVSLERAGAAPAFVCAIEPA